MAINLPRFHSKAKGAEGSAGRSAGGGKAGGWKGGPMTGSSFSKKPGSIDKLYKCNYSFYVYPDGEVEIAKNRFEDVKGKVGVDQLLPIFTRIIADLKLKDTDLDMFKEGLSELLQEAITPILKGDHYERAIRAASAGHGS